MKEKILKPRTVKMDKDLWEWLIKNGRNHGVNPSTYARMILMKVKDKMK